MFDLDLSAQNIFPARYRSVAISHDLPSLDEAALREHFVGRDAYMRTRFLVCRKGAEVALAEVLTEQSEELFSPISGLRLLADSQQCVWLERPEVDVGVASQFAALVAEYPAATCVIVEGRYSHVSFLLNPEPLWIDVLDITPPAPSKLLDQAQRILEVAEDLPPVGLRVEEVNSLDLLEASELRGATSILLPCKTTGVAIDGVTVSYLDQRPEKQEWALLGCTRSDEIHASFYGHRATRVDTCPRQFLCDDRESKTTTLTRCCLLQEGSEQRSRTVLVPWGSSLDEVRAAIEDLIEREGVPWSPT